MGQILPEGRKEAVIAHTRNIADRKKPKKGDTVTFDTIPNPRHPAQPEKRPEKEEAVNIRGGTGRDWVPDAEFAKTT